MFLVSNPSYELKPCDRLNLMYRRYILSLRWKRQLEWGMQLLWRWLVVEWNRCVLQVSLHAVTCIYTDR